MERENKEHLEALEQAFIEEGNAHQLKAAYIAAGLPEQAERIELQGAEHILNSAEGNCGLDLLRLRSSLRVFEMYGDERADLAKRALVEYNLARAEQANFLHDWLGDIRRAREYALELDDPDLVERVEWVSKNRKGSFHRYR